MYEYQRESTRRDEEGRANNNQAPPQDNQVPLLQEVAIGDQVSVVPLLMTDGDIRQAFLNLAQAMTSQSNPITSHVQAMIAKVNREIGP